MKTSIYSFFIILVLGCTTLFSQVNSNYDGPKPEVRAGAKSFVFQYTPFQSNLEPVYVGTVSVPDGTISSIDLVGAGFRYFVTNQIAIGLGLSFGTSSSSLETEAGKSESSATLFGVGVDANYHLMALYGISPYVGLNVNFGSLSGTDEFTPEGGVTEETEFSGNGFGVAAQLGFDWFFTEGLSLGGKYALGFRSLGEPEITSEGETEKGPSSTLFGISTFSVILNVHF
ncbi:MAG: outer membrane beta-barrel protein [Ignavibacteriaceae bacterium]|nr:outer membrane beta-barrel protein [Ignavibacteriaceae bacterium]